jgi:soluble lytic murein transglycosylase-like protein
VRGCRPPELVALALVVAMWARNTARADTTAVNAEMSSMLVSAEPHASRPVVRAQSQKRAALRARHQAVEPFVAEAARQSGVPVALVRAVIRVESDYFPDVVSNAGALGLMQLMPFNLERYGVADPFDPRSNILGGARLLRRLLELWKGNLVLALASYNAGAEAVRRHHGVPPYKETRGYVKRVLMHYRAYRSGHILVHR